MATYKRAKQNATKLKKKKILSHGSSTLFHMPFKDRIPHLSQIITFVTFIFLQKHFKKFQIKYFLVDIPVNLPKKHFG
jgi:hypothetical protein